MSAKSNSSELPARIVTGIVITALAAYCVYMGGLSYWLLIAIVTVVAFFEFGSITASAMPIRTGLFALIFLLLFLGADYAQMHEAGLIIVGIGAALLAAWEFLIRRSAWAALSVVYLVPFVIALLWLRASTDHGIFIVVFVGLCTIGSDIFAYFCGQLIGGPKLAVTISPNKTWSGAIGGLFGACALANLFAFWWFDQISVGGFLLALVLSVSSQIGDLFESWLKRRFGVKDSGRLLPGHGGVLDRIDGLIFAFVAAFLFGLAVSGRPLDWTGAGTALVKSLL